MMLYKNDILLFKSEEMEVYERILWISEDNSYCITITMSVENLLFNKRFISEIENSINEGVCKLHKEDLGLNKITDDNLTPVSIIHRNNAYEAIKYILDQDEEITILVNSKRRSEIIKDCKEKFNISKPSLYKYLRLYLQSGKLKNALLPNFQMCGAYGVLRNNISKSGRKSVREKVIGKRRGVVVDNVIRNKIEMAINRYYKNSDRNLQQTYELMVQDSFSKINEDGEIELFNEDEIPTFRQFQYYYYKNLDLEAILRGRKGNKKFDLTMRPLLSNSTFESFGPGFRYQIDATIADVYLVNRIDRSSVIGRPTLYLVVDVFSRMITGFSIGWDSPSWSSAASALYNCMENKVEVCKKYGFEICIEQWPSIGLPEILLADRGELVGPIADNIVDTLNITLENTPSYRGDAKGIVERSFKTVNENIKHLVPGAVKKDFRERGERRYELDAKLDIEDFTKIILLSIIEKNNRAIKGYPLTEEMIKDKVEPIPTELWKWGMKNKSGHLHTVSDDLLKASLLRDGKAVITERGIRFNNELYLTKLDNENERYIKARVKGKETVDILFDNRDMSVIYMLDKIEKKLIPCFSKKENTFSFNRTYEEIIDYYKCIRTIKNDDLRFKNLENKVNMNHQIKNIVDGAKKSSASKVDIKNKEENRKIENATLRKEQSLSNYIESNEIFNEDYELEKETENTSYQKDFEFIKEMKRKEKLTN